MTFEKVFLTDDKVRPIWRFFLSAFLLVVVGVAVSQVVGRASAAFKLPPQLSIALFHFALLLALLGLFKLLTAAMDERPLGSMGLAFHARWGRELCRGLGVGGLMVLSVAALERVLGSAHFALSGNWAARTLAAGALPCLFLMLAATNEEIAFRGYPFQRLVEAITPVGAIAATSGLFGLAHLGNPHHTWISTANTMLVGIPLAVAYLRTRALWMPMGIHFAWNFILGIVLGLPVSGVDFPVSLLTAQVHGNAWLTGADYGPEGSVLATLVIVGAALYLLFSRRIYISEEMKALVFGPAFGAMLEAAAVSPSGSRNPAEDRYCGPS